MFIKKQFKRYKGLEFGFLFPVLLPVIGYNIHLKIQISFPTL